MNKSTAQLRKDLAASIEELHQARDEDMVFRAAQHMAATGQALLNALAAQPVQQPRPWQVTFMHTRGPIRGKINRDSFKDLFEAITQMRTSAGFGAQVMLTQRTGSNRRKISANELAEKGYPEFAEGGQFASQYGEKHFSLEANR